MTLFEKKNVLGGQVDAAATPPFKSQLKGFLDYLIRQVKQLNVDIRYGVEITPDSPELKNADELILALGAAPIIPRIEGIENKNVIEVMDAHRHRHSEIGKKVIVAGGGLSGCDCALELAMEGKEVTIVEMLDEIAIKANAFNKAALNKKLPEYGVNILTGYKVLNFGQNSVTVEDKTGEKKELPSDTVIVAFGTKPCSDLAEKIWQVYPRAKIIGDCSAIGQVGEAVYTGFMAARTIY